MSDEELLETYRASVNKAMDEAYARDGFATNMSRESIVAGLRAVFDMSKGEKRAEWEAEQGETEWEYGHDCDESRATHHKNPSPQNPWQSMGTCTSATDYRRRKAGPWLKGPQQ